MFEVYAVCVFSVPPSSSSAYDAAGSAAAATAVLRAAAVVIAAHQLLGHDVLVGFLVKSREQTGYHGIL